MGILQVNEGPFFQKKPEHDHVTPDGSPVKKCAVPVIPGIDVTAVDKNPECVQIPQLHRVMKKRPSPVPGKLSRMIVSVQGASPRWFMVLTTGKYPRKELNG